MTCFGSKLYPSGSLFNCCRGLLPTGRYSTSYAYLVSSIRLAQLNQFVYTVPISSKNLHFIYGTINFILLCVSWIPSLWFNIQISQPYKGDRVGKILRTLIWNCLWTKCRINIFFRILKNCKSVLNVNV